MTTIPIISIVSIDGDDVIVVHIVLIIFVIISLDLIIVLSDMRIIIITRMIMITGVITTNSNEVDDVGIDDFIDRIVAAGVMFLLLLGLLLLRMLLL